MTHAALVACLICGACMASDAHARTDCFGGIENYPSQPEYLVEMRGAICTKLKAIQSPVERAFEQSIQRKWTAQHKLCGDESCREEVYTARFRELRHEPLNEQDYFSGNYHFGTKTGYQGLAHIVMLANDRFRYFIEISTGAPNWHSGEVFGEAVLRGTKGWTVRQKDNCLLSFKFSNAQLRTMVRSNELRNCSCAAGQGVWIEQTFHKAAQRQHLKIYLR